MSSFKFCLCALALFVCGQPASADQHYMLIFSEQRSVINLPSRSHTWGVFVRASDSGALLEVLELNWFAADMKIGFFQLAEPGINRRYIETIESAIAKRATVCMWGPFQIQPELFERAKLRTIEIEAGLWEYSMIDLGRRYRAPNCQHMLSDLRDDSPYLRTLLARGERGSEKVAKHLSVFIVDGSCGANFRRYPEIVGLLGLQRYPIERRELRRD